MRNNTTQSMLELKYSDELWLTDKGKILHFYEMDRMHIFNTVNLLKRHQKRYDTAGKNQSIEFPHMLMKRYNDFREEAPEYFI